MSENGHGIGAAVKRREDFRFAALRADIRGDFRVLKISASAAGGASRGGHRRVRSEGRGGVGGGGLRGCAGKEAVLRLAC